MFNGLRVEMIRLYYMRQFAIHIELVVLIYYILAEFGDSYLVLAHDHKTLLLIYILIHCSDLGWKHVRDLT